MKTPIYDFVEEYSKKNYLRLHMPGHKGKVYCNPLSEIFPYDITEIKGADELFAPSGIIKLSELNATKLFGSKGTFYSTEGSTLGIQTMLALATKTHQTIIAPRNVHKAFINSCILLDLNVTWVYPSEENEEYNIVSYRYSCEDIEKAIIKSENIACVYITSPDYYGRMADIKEIKKICEKYDLPLLVDNAHGSHLAFLSENIHPIKLGADMCCDSAHKMLPVLTGGGYLHINNEKYLPFVKDTMAMFSTTSPSYLIMTSLDLCNSYLENSIKRDLEDIVPVIKSIKEKLAESFEIVESEPLRITIYTAGSGLCGTEVADILRESKIECEYADESYIVFLFSPISSKEEVNYFYEKLSSIKQSKIQIKEEKINIPKPKRAMSLRDAALSSNESIRAEKALGRICGKTRVLCPPGIAVVASGEIIDKKAIEIMKRFGIDTINVVK